MSISSMTGFARVQGGGPGLSWTWEVKSVNGRGLDFRARLPTGMDALEAAARARLTASLKRGHVNVVLQVSRSDGEAMARINHAVLTRIIDEALEVAAERGLPPPRIDGLLGLSGVVEFTEPPEIPAQRQQREADMLKDFGRAVDALAEARRQEGGRLAEIMTGHVEALRRLTGEARGAAALAPEVIAGNLRARLDELLNAEDGVSEDRLAQEIALLASKADVREEVDRLDAHIAAVAALLEAGGAVGRRLDFLAQELNREANTLCSKVSDMALKRIGLELKAVIDQLREQLQNIE